MAQIDWGLLQQPDFFGNALRAQQLGQQQAVSDTRQNALRQYATDPQGAITQLTAVDPATAVNLQRMSAAKDQATARAKAAQQQASGDMAGAQTTALASGDDQMLASIRQISEDQRAAAKQRADTIANAAYSVKSVPYPQRKAALAAMAPQLSGLGIGADQLSGFDPTDENINAVVSQTLGVSKMIDLAKPIEMDPTKRYVQSDLVGGGAPPAASAPASSGTPPSATQPAAATAQPPSGGVYDQVAQYAQKNGATADEGSYLQRLAQVESSGDPNAQNGSSTGVFQFHPDTFAGLGGRDIHNVGQQTAAALALSRRDRQNLQTIGVDPTDANVYIMHQQGAAGGRALLTADPSASAVDVLTPIYGNAAIAKKAVVGNGGSPDMSAGQFVSMWQQRWGGGAPNAGQAAQAAGSPAPQGAPTGFHVVQDTQTQWKPDGQGSLVNIYSGDRKTDPSFQDDTGALTPDAINMNAMRFAMSGQLPPTGVGKQAAADKRAIMNKASDVIKQYSIKPEDWVTGLAQFKVAQGSLQQVSKVRSLVAASENTVLANADLALSLASKGAGPTGVPVFNRWIQAGRKELRGDPDVAKFNAALGTVADEYAKVMTTSTGTGGAGTSDSARAEAYHRLNSAMTLDQLQGVVNVMKQEMANRTRALQGEEDVLTSQLRNGVVAPGTQPAAGSPPGAPGAPGAPRQRPPLSAFNR